MTNSEQLVFQAGALGVALAVTTYFLVRRAVALYQQVKFEYDYMKHPRLVAYSDQQACMDPHIWKNVALALRGLPFGEYKVCTACGAICGNTEVMASDMVLKQIREGLEINAKKAALEAEIQERIRTLAEVYVDQYIRRNFVKEINDAHFADKLRALSMYAVVALTSATDKVAAELTSESELEERYQGWPSKIKGNA